MEWDVLFCAKSLVIELQNNPQTVEIYFRTIQILSAKKRQHFIFFLISLIVVTMATDLNNWKKINKERLKFFHT